MLDRREVERVHTELTRQGRIEECWTAMQTALSSFRDDSEVHLLAGLTLLQLQRGEEAVQILSRARALAPDDGLVETFLAKALYLAGRFAEAEKACDRLLDTDRTNLLALAYRGLARLALGRSEGEWDVRIFLIRVGQNRRAFGEMDPALLQEAAAALARLGRPIPVPDAEGMELEFLLEQELWGEVLQRCQGRTTAWHHYYRGRALFGLDRHREGVEAYTQALALEPSMMPAYVRRAAAFLFVNTELAIADCRYSLEAGDPDDAAAWEHLGTALRNLKRFPEAVEALERAHDLTRDQATGGVLQNLGFCHLHTGEPAKARDYLDAAVESFWGCTPEVVHFRGLAEYELGNYDAARADFQRYLAENPDGPARQDARHMLRRIAQAETPTPRPEEPDLETADSQTLGRLKAAAAGGDWPTLQQFLEPLRGNERAFYLSRLAELEGRPTWLDAWVEAVPDSPLPWLFRGRQGTQWAWEARTDKPADEVSPEAWDLFHERLLGSRHDLTVAAGLAPDDATPFAFMITVAMGLGEEPALSRQLFEAALGRCPEHRAAWENYLYSQTHRWSRRPPTEAMTEAFEYCRRLPEAHPLWSLVPQAAINLAIDKGLPPNAMAGNPGLVHCVQEAYTRGLGSPLYQEDLHTLEDRNLFAFTLDCCGRHDLAKREFERLGLRKSKYPWSLMPDPEKRFRETRAYCLEI